MPSEDFTVTTDDGVTLWATRTSRCGDVPMILCHGGPGGWDQMEDVADMVDDLIDVVRWDQRGCGRSERSGPYSLARSIADVDCVRAAIGASEAVIAGHSWGAGLALRYALRHPGRTRALACISGTDLSWHRHRALYRQERLDRLGDQRHRWEELRGSESPTDEEARELLLLNSSTDFADRARALELAALWNDERFVANDEANAAINADTAAEDASELRRGCARLDVETLVVHGSADPRPLAGPAELAEVLPRARLAVLEGVGHLPWAEQPERLRSALRDFLGTTVCRHV